MARTGWYNKNKLGYSVKHESHRHSLASRGIKTNAPKGVKNVSFALSPTPNFDMVAKGKPSQIFRTKFYKKMTLDGTVVYLFENNQYLGKKKILGWLSAYNDKDKKHFLVESGAGIPREKMENQIKTYLERKFGTNKTDMVSGVGVKRKTFLNSIKKDLDDSKRPSNFKKEYQYGRKKITVELQPNKSSIVKISDGVMVTKLVLPYRMNQDIFLETISNNLNGD